MLLIIIGVNGYDDKWIKQRLTGVVDRRKLTDVWKESGITKNYEYGVLTNEIYQEWSGMKASQYKEYKGLRKESLRDNMTDIEVALTDLGEITTRELVKKHKPYGLDENRKVAKMGGHAAKVARDYILKNEEELYMEFDDDRQTGAIGKANERWNELHSNYERDKIKYDDWLELFKRAIDSCKTPIIDLGCGSGNDTLYLVERGKKVIPCDYSSNAIQNIQKNFPEVERTECFDMTRGLPFEDNFTDLMI